jgi:hypothetical protein
VPRSHQLRRHPSEWCVLQRREHDFVTVRFTAAWRRQCTEAGTV